jgi:inosine/xanthosine triphosphatase
MNSAIGSKNPAKVQAVESVTKQLYWNVEPFDAPSMVSAQPFSDEETQKGALNRARACVANGFDIGIGLEGGVVDTDDGMFLCNWGALVTKDQKQFVASGAKILLPEEIAGEIRDGRELGDVMADYTAKKDVRKKEGAVGIFTDGWVTRDEMFAHVVKLLVGQYEYHRKHT